MPYCEKCGKQLSDDAMFCAGCGAQRSTEVVQIPAQFSLSKKSSFCLAFLQRYGIIEKREGGKDADKKNRRTRTI